ncbi:nuclear transport factor 2 family protein [Pseudomonas fluorescens]
MDLEAHLISLEQALQQSTTRTDAAQLERLLAHDFVEFGASGNVWGSKAEVIAGLQDEAFSARHMTECAVKVLSDGVALVTYRGYREGVGESLRSSVWRQEEGQWRMVFHQGTPV